MQAGDEQTASAVAKGLTKKRKQLSKPLRCELIAGVHRPVSKIATQPGPKPKGKVVLPHQRRQPQLQQKHQGKGVYKLPAASTYDLWNVEAEQTDPRLDKHNNIPGAINGSAGRPSKRRKQAVKPTACAVEVDAAGCSYNPDVEHHQEALSQAVATEMQKVYKQDLLPKRVPRFVDYEPETDELALLQVDAEPDSDDDSAAPSAAAASGKPVAAVSLRTKRIKKDRGLELRRRLREEEDERRRALKAQRRDIDNVKHIQQQLQEEEADRCIEHAQRHSWHYCRRTAYSICCHDQQSWSAVKVVMCCTLQCEPSTRDCKAGSTSRVAAALVLFLRLQHAAVPVMCQATVKAAVKDRKHFAYCRQEVRAAKAAAKAEKAMHEPPRLGKVKFEAEPVQVMMTNSALLGPGAPVMLSVSTAVTVLPSDSCDALSMSYVAGACTSLQWVAKTTSGLDAVSL